MKPILSRAATAVWPMSQAQEDKHHQHEEKDAFEVLAGK